MEAKNYDSLIEVFRGDLWEAELIKGLLKSMLKDETPLSAVTSSYGGGSVCVLVNKEEEVYARKVVAERKV